MFSTLPMNGSFVPASELPGLAAAGLAGDGAVGAPGETGAGAGAGRAATPGDEPRAPPSGFATCGRAATPSGRGLGVPTGDGAGAAGAEPRGGEAAGAALAGDGVAVAATWSPPWFFGETITVACEFDAAGVSLCPQFPQNRAAASRFGPH